MKVNTYIFGYTDVDKQDEIVLCALCGGPFFKAAPMEWTVLRAADAQVFKEGRDCDKCGAQIYFASGPDPRLEVYSEYLETLDF